MKKILFFIVLFLLVAVVGIGIFLATLDVNDHKETISAFVKERTGREVTIAGDISLSLFPNIALNVRDVSIDNPFPSSHPFLALEVLKVDVSLFSLLDGQVNINQFELVKPKLYLEVDQQGKANWELLQSVSGDTTKREPKTREITRPQEPEKRTTLQQGKIHIKDAVISYVNRQLGQHFAAKQVTLELEYPEGANELTLDGSATIEGTPLEFNVILGSANGELGKGNIGVSAEVKSAFLTSQYKGNVSIDPAISLDGNFAMDVTDLKALDQLLTKVTSPLDLPFGKIASKGQVEYQKDALSLSALNVTIDQMQLQGDVNMLLHMPVPIIQADLKTNVIDVRPYIKRMQGNVQPTAAKQSSGKVAAQSEQLPLDWMEQINFDTKLDLEGVVADQFTLGKTVLRASLADRLLEATIKEMQCYKGQITGKVTVNNRGNTPQLTKKLKVEGIDVGPFLHENYQFDRITGQGNAQLHVEASGKTVSQMIRTLSGYGDLSFKEGQVKGVDFISLTKQVKALANPLSWDRNDTATNFSEMSGTFKIANGVFDNNDLKIVTPVILLFGSGTIDFPHERINYRLKPESASGTSGGLLVPVIVKGSLDKPKILPDLKATAIDIIKEPTKVKKQLKNLEGTVKQFKGIEKGLKKQLKDGILPGLIQGF